MSEQLVLSGATAKLPTWQRQEIPSTPYELAAYREIAKRAVFKVWSTGHRPTNLAEIYAFTAKYVGEQIAIRQWPHAKFVRSKQYVDRRVNEIASPEFAEDGVIKIVAVRAGIYQPNPALFELPKLREERLAST